MIQLEIYREIAEKVYLYAVKIRSKIILNQSCFTYFKIVETISRNIFSAFTAMKLLVVTERRWLHEWQNC